MIPTYILFISRKKVYQQFDSVYVHCGGTASIFENKSYGAKNRKKNLLNWLVVFFTDLHAIKKKKSRKYPLTQSKSNLHHQLTKNHKKKKYHHFNNSYSHTLWRTSFHAAERYPLKHISNFETRRKGNGLRSRAQTTATVSASQTCLLCGVWATAILLVFWERRGARWAPCVVRGHRLVADLLGNCLAVSVKRRSFFENGAAGAV